MPLAIAAVVTHLRLRVDQVELDLPRGELRLAATERSAARLLRFDPDGGTAWIDFAGGARSFPTYSFVDVLREELSDDRGRRIAGGEAFAGRLVFVGATDPGLGDFFVTPFSARLPGVEMHANVAENILQGHQLLAGADYDLTVVLSALTAAAVVAVVAATYPVLPALVVVGVIGAFWLGITFAQFSQAGRIWNWTVPGMTIVFAFTIVTAYRQLTEEREKRRIRSVFSTYVAPAVVSQMLEDPDKFRLGGTRCECTIFFSDVVGFTTLSESIDDPEKLVSLMNRYLGSMTRVILDRGGLLDKYIGDAIMAIFGVPLPEPDHAARACRAALGNREALRELRNELRAESLPEIDCRIGINTGEVVVGNVGSALKMDYTVLGDPVNLASRLEAANKEYGTHILVSGQTRMEAEQCDRDLVFRLLDMVAVKGKSVAVEIYELVGERAAISPEKRKLLDLFAKGLAFYRERCFAEAENRFQEALLVDPQDGPSRTYVARCQEFMLEPPPPSWDGVFEMRTK
jgi:adenylate cyclase